jgi:hypothetical protein
VWISVLEGPITASLSFLNGPSGNVRHTLTIPLHQWWRRSTDIAALVSPSFSFPSSFSSEASPFSQSLDSFSQSTIFAPSRQLRFETSLALLPGTELIARYTDATESTNKDGRSRHMNQYRDARGRGTSDGGQPLWSSTFDDTSRSRIREVRSSVEGIGTPEVCATGGAGGCCCSGGVWTDDGLTMAWLPPLRWWRSVGASVHPVRGRATFQQWQEDKQQHINNNGREDANAKGTIMKSGKKERFFPYFLSSSSFLSSLSLSPPPLPPSPLSPVPSLSLSSFSVAPIASTGVRKVNRHYHHQRPPSLSNHNKYCNSLKNHRDGSIRDHSNIHDGCSFSKTTTESGIDVMLHRSLATDDEKGLGEPVIDSTRIETTHWLTIGSHFGSESIALGGRTTSVFGGSCGSGDEHGTGGSNGAMKKNDLDLGIGGEGSGADDDKKDQEDGMVATGCLHEDAIHILALRWQSVDHDNPPVMLPRRTWKEMRQPQRWPLQQSVAEGAASSSSSPSSSSSLTSSSVGIGLPRYGGGVVRILQQPLPPLVHLLSLQWWNIPNDPRPTKSDDGTFDSEDEFGAGLDAGIVGSASVGGIGSGGAGSYSAGGGCDHINKKRRSSGRDSSVTNFPIVAAALRSVRHPKSIRELFLRFQHLALGTNAVAATINAATKQVLMIRTETASSLKPNITKSEIGGSFIAAKASAINTINPALSPKES